MTPRGFVKLPRNLVESPLWLQLRPSVWKVYCAFLLKANYKPGTLYDHGRNEVEVPAGSFVTSYAKMAQFCDLTVQQTRDSFEHIEKLGFATYQRTRLWTLVTLLKIDTCEELEEDENTPENKERTHPGTEKEHTEDQIKNNDRRKKEVKNTTTARFSAEIEAQLNQVTSSLYGRHPRKRRCSQTIIRKKLTAICRATPAAERISKLQEIDSNHSACCGSEQWRKSSGEFVKGLSNWLSLDGELFNVSLDTESEEPEIFRHMMQ